MGYFSSSKLVALRCIVILYFPHFKGHLNYAHKYFVFHYCLDGQCNAFSSIQFSKTLEGNIGLNHWASSYVKISVSSIKLAVQCTATTTCINEVNINVLHFAHSAFMFVVRFLTKHRLVL